MSDADDISTERDAIRSQDPCEFVSRLGRTTKALFDRSELSDAFDQIVEDANRDLATIRRQIGGATLPVLVFGRHDLRNSEFWHKIVADDFPENSKRTVWIGADPPPTRRVEDSFIAVSRSSMPDVGQPYVLGFVPPIDANQTFNATDEAIPRAAVKIVVMHADDFEVREYTKLLYKMPGSLVVPVILFGKRSGEIDEGSAAPLKLIRDVDDRSRVWRNGGCGPTIEAPCFLFEEASSDELRDRLRQAVSSIVSDDALLAEAVRLQSEARLSSARQAASEQLGWFRDRVEPKVKALESRCGGLPNELFAQLLGSDAQIRTIVRQRQRVLRLEATPSICFPYRSFAGVLHLTAGAWDRLILGLAGNWVSLAVAAFKSLRNASDSAEVASRLREGVALRVERLAREKMRKEIDDFNAMMDAATTRRTDDAAMIQEPSHRDSRIHRTEIEVEGLLELESQFKEILDAEVSRAAPSRYWSLALGMTATLAFLLVIAGPAVTIYKEYLAVAWGTIDGTTGSWSDFPIPSLPLVSTAIALSCLPVFLIAMFAMWSATWKAERCKNEIKKKCNDASDGFRIGISDPRIRAARELIDLLQDAR